MLTGAYKSLKTLFACICVKLHNHGRIQRGGGYRGCGPPLKNHKYIGFLSNTGPNLLKNHKATKPEFNIGQSSARQTPFKWRFAGGPMMAHLKWYLAPISPHQSTIKKIVIKFGPPPTKLAGFADDNKRARASTEWGQLSSARFYLISNSIICVFELRRIWCEYAVSPKAEPIKFYLMFY